MDFLAKLRTANKLRNDEWDPKGKLDVGFSALELAGEVGELCNKIKKLERAALGLKGSRVTIEEIRAEIGDAQICLDLLAMKLDTDIASVATEVFNIKSKELGLTIFIEKD